MDRGCRNCMWLYHMVTYNPTAPCSECLDYDKWETMKQTNADRIRSMSDEELAAWIETFAPSGTFQFWLNGKTWLQWLRQEAGRDGRAD